MDLNTMDNTIKSVFLNHKSALLYSAAKSGDQNLAHLLLDQCQADPNTKDIRRFTPLFEASQNGHAEVVQLLIRYGADVNKDCEIEVQDENRLLGHNEGATSSFHYVTPLHIAVMHKQLETAKILIENGAEVNVDVGYRSGFTPLFSAVNEKLFEIAKLLIQNGAEINSEERELTLLQIAIDDKDLNMVKLLVENGANTHQLLKHGYTHLYFATWRGNLEVIKFLTDSGANICQKTKDGNLPIHGFIDCWKSDRDENSSMKILQILTTPETVNSIYTTYHKRLTTLGLAAENGLLQVVKFLLDNGAIPYETDLLASKNEQTIELLKNEIEIRKSKMI